MIENSTTPVTEVGDANKLRERSQALLESMIEKLRSSTNFVILVLDETLPTKPITATVMIQPKFAFAFDVAFHETMDQAVGAVIMADQHEQDIQNGTVQKPN